MTDASNDSIPRIIGDAPSPSTTQASVSLHEVTANDVQVCTIGSAIFGNADIQMHPAGSDNRGRLLELRAIGLRLADLAEIGLAASTRPPA